MASNEVSFFGLKSEIVQDRRLTGITEHVVGHKGLLLLVEAALVADSAEIFAGHPLSLVGVLSATELLIRGPLILGAYPDAWL